MTPMTTIDHDRYGSKMTDEKREQYDQRRRRFNAILGGYECDALDYEGVELRSYRDAVLGADRQPEVQPQPARLPTTGEHRDLVQPDRYVLVSENVQGVGYFVENVNSPVRAAEAGARHVAKGMQPVCYYDLDELAGDEPLPEQVEWDDTEWMVHGLEYSADRPIGEDPQPTGRWILKKQPDDRRRSTYDWETVDPSEINLLGWKDERMPVRYSVAKIETLTVVAFNTIPERP
jgi:hypothetical protein